MQPLAKSRIDAAPPGIAWDECACLLCGKSDYAPLLEAADVKTQARFLIVRCKRCGLCFTNPRPDLASMAPFYPVEYRCHQLPSAKSGRRADAIAKLLPPSGQARLLDVGCGAGGFLDRMQSIGWHVTGLDTSHNAIAGLRARGLTAHVGALPQPHWHDASFDAITLWQSLEHLHQPLEALQEVHRLLTPEGMLLVAVPNFDGWAARHFAAQWYALDLPRHLTHFTPITLTAMLERAGFTRIDMRQESHHSWIRHSARTQGGTLAKILRTRLGSGIAGWWASTCGLSEGLLAIARKPAVSNQ